MSPPWVGLCWMSKILQGWMIPRFHRYGFCIGTGYTGGKFRRNFGGPSWEEDVGGIKGLQGRMIPGNGRYGPGSYRSWPYRRKFGSRKCVKNLVKLRSLLIWDAPGSVLSKKLFRLQDFVKETRFRAQKNKFLSGTFFEGICWYFLNYCLLYTSPSPRDKRQSRMPSSA